MNDVMRREHERIARELHDRLGQTLAGLKMDVAWLQRRLLHGTMATPAVVRRLEEMMQHIDASVDEVRTIAYSLRTPTLSPEEMRDTLESHVRAMAARGNLSVYCDIDHDLPLSAEQCLQIFRIVQETLTNILRHANARGVWMSLSATSEGVELRIRDDGKGLRSAHLDGSPKTLGLQGMAERAGLIDARLTVQAAPQGGTIVHLVLPRGGAGLASSDSSFQLKKD